MRVDEAATSSENFIDFAALKNFSVSGIAHELFNDQRCAAA